MRGAARGVGSVCKRRWIRMGKPVPEHRRMRCRKSKGMVRPAGLEPAASRLEVSRSIQMSYGRVIFLGFSGLLPGCKP